MSGPALAELPAAGTAGAHARRAGLTLAQWLTLILIVSLLFPYRIEAGPFLLSPNRALLLLMLLPCMFALMAGAAGRLRIADILIFCHAAWMALALVKAHGVAEAIEPAGIHMVEVVGSWLVARCFVRSADSFRLVVKTLFISIVIMLPLLVAENLTGRHYINELLTLVAPTQITHEMAPRMGLERAFGAFDHPILLGVYCVGIFSLSWYVLGYGKRWLPRLMRTGLVTAGTVASVSSGPLLALVVQSIFMGWDYVTRKLRARWLVLGGLCGILYALIDLLSNRTPFHVIVTYLTFNSSTAYNRIRIWELGSAEVARHPLFGIGLGEWQRPDWLSDSMDNFWMVLAVRGGLPAFLFFAGALLALCVTVARVRLTDPRLIAYRRGWMITILGFVIAGSAVHYWKTIFCLVVFLIGSIAWITERRAQGAAPVQTRPAMRRPRPATIRFG